MALLEGKYDMDEVEKPEDLLKSEFAISTIFRLTPERQCLSGLTVSIEEAAKAGKF